MRVYLSIIALFLMLPVVCAHEINYSCADIDCLEGTNISFDILFSEDESTFYERDRAVLKHLDQPRPIDYLIGRGIIYREFPNDDPFIDLLKWFEVVHIEKQLQHLSRLGQVIQDPDSGLWFRN